jgi:hypothetical protein
MKIRFLYLGFDEFIVVYLVLLMFLREKPSLLGWSLISLVVLILTPNLKL